MPNSRTSACTPRRRIARWLTPIAVVLVTVAASRLHAQKLQFRQLTPDNGLLSSQVDAIQQDSRGLMWFGSLRGLSRYDGYSFIHYRHRANDSASLADNRVNALYEDPHRTLWVGTRLGLSRYDASRDAFTNYRLASPETLEVNVMLEVKGVLLVGTARGLFAVDRATGRSTPYGGAVFAKLSIGGLYEDRAAHVWVGTETAGAFDLDPTSGAVRAWPGNPAIANTLPGRDVRAFHEDSSGAMWITSYDGGLARLDRVTGQVTRFSIDPRDPLLAASKRIRSLLPEGNRGLWLGTENGGLDYFDFATKRFHHNRFDPNDPSSITNNSVWALHRDRSGTLWAGTWAGGLNIARQNGDAIHRYRSVAGDAQSLSFNSVIAFAEDRRGGIWVATDGGGLNRFERATGRFERFTSLTSNLNSDAVLAIAEDHDGLLWVGTWGGGVSRFDPATKRFTAFTKANSAVNTIGVFSLLVDRRGMVWIGTWREGLQRYDPRRRTFTRVPLAATESPIHVIVEASDGKLLVATESGGFFIVDPVSGAKTHYRAGKDGISSDQVTSVLEAGNDVVWIGTFEGLDRLDRRTNTITHFTEADGLASSFVAGIALDDAQTLWISGDRGITRFDPVARKGKQYGMSDGLQGNEFNVGAYYHAKDGTLFFGGTRGFSTLRPDRIVENPHAPQVTLTGFTLLNKPVTIGAPGSPLDASITVAEKIVLRHDHSAFTIEFAALDFAASGKNQYAYKLEGLDDDWNDVGTRRSAAYTKVPPGSYVFHVKGANNDGIWNAAGTSIRVEVLPPYWATWWFRVLVLVAIAGALICVARMARLRLAATARAAKVRADNEERQRLASNIRHLLDASGEGIYGLDLHGCITFANQRGSEMLGYQPEDLVGRSMHEVAHHSHRDGSPYPASDCPIQRGACEGVACDVDDEVLWHKDGTAVQVEYAASPVRDDGRLTGAVVNFRDITARRRAELELVMARDVAEAASRAKSDFLARMSHELRTPLNSIIGFANVLLRNKRQALRSDELTYLDRIAGSGKHLLGLINDVLDLSKIEAGQMTMETTSVMLDEVVRETLEGFETQAREKGVRLHAVLPKRTRPIDTDAVRLKQVLINLVGNALKFTEQGEVAVAVAVGPDLRPSHLTVRDTGIGIPEDRLAAVFNAFEQADCTTTRRFGGTGLGLAISRTLCEALGHHLEAESAVGVGTMMTIRFRTPIESSLKRTPRSEQAVRADAAA